MDVASGELVVVRLAICLSGEADVIDVEPLPGGGNRVEPYPRLASGDRYVGQDHSRPGGAGGEGNRVLRAAVRVDLHPRDALSARRSDPRTQL